MADLEKVIKGLECCSKILVAEALALLKEQEPTVDAVPVKHGRWVKGELTPDSWRFCSICSFPRAVRRAQWYYCPSCGAKMDEGEEDA